MKTISKFCLTILSVVLAALLPTHAFATKPCMKMPCMDADHCAEIAEWVAEGEIADVTHDVKGMPLNKDFASFTFRVTRWIKPHADGATPDTIDFKVGWCDNAQEVPKDESGLFRFYGADAPDSQTPHYLYFKPVIATEAK